MAPRPLANEFLIQMMRFQPTSDLMSVPQTSRLFSKLAEPIHYLELDITKPKHGPGRAIGCILQTLVKRPELASHVKHAVFRVPHSIHIFQGETLDLSFITSEGKSWIREKSVESPEWATDLLSAGKSNSVSLSPGNWGAVVSFLIHLLSQSLETLTMFDHTSWSKPYDYIDEVLRRAAEQQNSAAGRSSLCCLRKVKFLPAGGRREYPSDLGLSNIVPYLEL